MKASALVMSTVTLAIMAASYNDMRIPMMSKDE